MGYDPELEEILKSIKNDKKAGEHKTEPINLPPPKPRYDFTRENPEPIPEPEPEESAFTEELRTESEPEAAPVAVTVEEEIITPVSEETQRLAKKISGEFEEAPPKREKPAKAEKPKKEKAKNDGAKVALPVAVISVIIALCVCIGGFVFGHGLYVKKYEAKYGISFPKGIPMELCDYYGQNQSLAGSVSFKDYGDDIPVYSEPPEDGALFEKGSSVKEEQHYRAIALNNGEADIEALYKDGESFVKASQQFTFKTVYGENEKYQVIAAYIINTRPEDDNGYAFPYNCYGNFTPKSYRHYQDTIKCRSIYKTGYKITPEDYCMTVSVPTDIMPDFRFVIVGVKREKPERITQTKPNDRVRYPQVYCDKLGVHNIYAQFSSKWFPEIVTNENTGDTRQLSAEDFQ
ncbi:MAG: hypothetical protein K6C14_03160 [Eubacterium sp.]|nr:hypothetical protein [Eubacterium sp.]